MTTPASAAVMGREVSALVAALLRNRHQLREYYQRQILLEPTEIVIADTDRTFLEQAMRLVEEHLTDPAFSVLVLASTSRWCTGASRASRARPRSSSFGMCA